MDSRPIQILLAVYGRLTLWLSQENGKNKAFVFLSMS